MSEGLREALAEELASLYAYATSHGTVECDWTEDADTLLAGPLAALIADAERVRRVEEVLRKAETAHRLRGWSAPEPPVFVSVDLIRRVLGGETL